MTFRIEDVLIFDVRIEAEVWGRHKKVPRKELTWLQPLGQKIFFQRSQALLDGSWLYCIAEAYVTLALAPEDHAGNGGDMCLGEQDPGGMTAIFADLCHPWKRV